jgi:hypothetical protein
VKRVPAYWGKRQTTPKACPLGKRACFVDGERERWCEHYHIGSVPPLPTRTGSCFVNCSAPKKAKKK